MIDQHPMTNSVSHVREPVAVIPEGGPFITVLGAYVGRTERYTELAMRCRRCDFRVEGTSLHVHAELREHHDREHPVVTTLVPRQPTPPKTPIPVGGRQCAGPDCVVMVHPVGKGVRLKYCSSVCRSRARVARMREAS